MSSLLEKLPLPYHDIPSNWRVHFIDELAEIATGDSNTQDKVKNGHYPFFVRSQTIERTNKYTFDGKAILTAGDGVGVGKVFHLVDGKFAFHQRVYRISGFKSAIHAEYLFEYFKQNFIRQVVKFTAKTSVDSVRMEMIAKMVVPVPPILEQCKITKILSTWDKAITTTGKLIATSKQQKKALMQQLLTGKKRLLNPETGKTFQGEWEEVKLGDVTSIYDGTHSTPKYVEKGVPFYSVEHLTRGCFLKTKFISEEVFDKENKRVKLEIDDILMTRIGDIGTAICIDWDVRASFYVSLALIKANKNKYSSQFLGHYINSQKFQSELHKRTIHVAFPKKINLGEINNCLVLLPAIEEQQKIASVLTSADKEIELLEAKLAHLKQEKKALMQQLLTGKRRVKVEG